MDIEPRRPDEPAHEPATAERTSTVVGLDLTSVKEISASISQFGDRFLDRIYTPGELLYCLGDIVLAPMRLAARFAAKEAVIKVLRVNDDAVSWRSIEVTRAPGGACDIALAGQALALARSAGFTGFSLSMTHGTDHAAAVVLGERHHPAGAS